MISQTDMVVDASVSLEQLLERQYGAVGTGLGEKVTSIQDKLAEGLVRKLRYIARARNKLLHDRAPLEDETRFREHVQHCMAVLTDGRHVDPVAYLQAHAPEPPAPPAWWHGPLYFLLATPMAFVGSILGDNGVPSPPPTTAWGRFSQRLQKVSFAVWAVVFTCFLLAGFVSGWREAGATHGVGGHVAAGLLGLVGAGIAGFFVATVMAYLTRTFYIWLALAAVVGGIYLAW
jgi:hypothetical protein